MNKIMAIKVDGRNANALHVQETLTKYGCSIKTRVGFHEASADLCATDGIIVLQLFGPESETKALYDTLEKLEGVTPRMIEF